MQECVVDQIFYYPVKGCRAVAAQEVEIGPTGITGDRKYVILHEEGFGNLKVLPELSRVAVAVTQDGLTFAADGHDTYTHQRVSSGEITMLPFYADKVAVTDQGDDVAAWLSAVTGKTLRLGTLQDSFDRNLPMDSLANAHGVTQDGFCDLSPVLLVNAATLDDVNQKLSANVPVERFRCNIVVRGLEPYAEDSIERYEGGGVTLSHVTACERCVIINTDPVDGTMNKEPLKLLHGYRRKEGGYASGVMFGNYFNVSGTQKLAVGDRLKVS